MILTIDLASLSQGPGHHSGNQCKLARFGLGRVTDAGDKTEAPLKHYRAPEQKDKREVHTEKTDIWFAT